uniref:uroporphyrinogen decarboxylase family protein n=1 Tax=uncultured Draconibacterium sp. TaxID=1573823 RepID=UPI003216C981
MNSRDFVLKAINHKETGKVPVDMGSNPSSGISAIAYSNLLKYLGMDHLPVQIYDVVQQLAQPQNEIIDLFGIDVLDIGRTFNDKPNHWQPTILANGDQAFYPKWFNPEKNDAGDWIAKHSSGLPIAKMPGGATFFDQIHFPWVDGYPDTMNGLDDAMSKVLWSAFVHSPWDNASMPGFWDELRKRAIQLKETTNKALMIVVGCNLFEWGTFIRRMDNFMMDLYLEPDNVESLLDALMERHLATLAKVCEAVGDVVDIVRFGDDLGAMNGPFMDPELYRQLFKPRHKQLCDFVKQNSKMHTFLHSCGSIYKLIPDLIEAGYDILNPMQTQCTDMQPEKLKNEFGKEITFWGGGIETVGTLNAKNPEEVRAEVLNRLEILSKGGGYVFNTVHNIMPDVPPENIVAMFNAVKEFNGEPKIETIK